MKKAIIIIAALFCGIVANAQWYIGGGLNFSSSNNSNSFQIAPEAGYNFNDKIGVGAVVSFGIPTNNSNRLSITPYLRYRFLNIDRFHLFFDASLGYTFQSQNMSEGASLTNSWAINVRPGVSFDISKHVSILAHLGYLGFEQDFHCFKSNSGITTNHEPTCNFGLSASNGLALSVYYSF